MNLSKRSLTQHQIRLLTRGPKFCPVKSGTKSDMYGGIKTFSKKLALQETYFDSTYVDNSLIRLPSKKHATTKNKDLADIISTVNKITPVTKRTSDNLSKEEREALTELQQLSETTIEIKKADKSNTLVVMDKDDYKRKLVLEDHLHTPTYEKAADDAKKKVFLNLKKLCNEFQHCITSNERKMILKDDWSESQFYVLPKIHKSKAIIDHISTHSSDYVEIPFPNDLKGRPINGDVNSVTQGLSKLMDKVLNPLVSQLKTYIKDEYDFLRTFPRKIPKNARILCCDVISLYTSIPTDLGLTALDYWVTKLSSSVPERFTKKFILTSVQFILENNNFQFDAVMWHQRSGTAMGKSFAPPYACLTMGYLEETILFPKLLPRYFSTDIVILIIEFFLRFIDDGIMVLPVEVQAEYFLKILNMMHPAIQYTGSNLQYYTMDGITYIITNFLSIKVLVDSDGVVKFDVYYKETNAHDYLAYDSHHPEHTRNNIPYVLAKRILVITSEDSWVERNLRDLKEFLLSRQYPIGIIDKGFYNAKLQGPAGESSTNKVVPMITPFLGNFDSSNIVNTTRDLISSSSNARVRDAFMNTKFVQCYNQTPNLLQSLSSSQFKSPSSIQQERGTFRCGSKRCEICQFSYLQECKSFVTSNGTDWKIKRHITCNSLNVIYFLKCSFCMHETKLGKAESLRIRHNNHRVGCRGGKGTDVFDNHVFNCAKSKGLATITEPNFLLYVMMECSDYNKLLSIERKLHLDGHDTTFKLL